MDMTELLTFVTNNGFSIVMALLLFKNLLDEQARHKEEVDKLSSAIDNNTMVMQRLYDQLERGKE